MNSTPITIAGNLADVPEVRSTPGGRASARMRVAVNGRYQDASGAWTDGATSWHTVVAWGALAEHVGQLPKGERVVIHGRIEQRDYTTDSGERRAVWEVIADEIGLSLRHAAANRSTNGSFASRE